MPVSQYPGDTVTYSGRLLTTGPGTATLKSTECKFADGTSCALEGTVSFTSTEGTLTGTITSDKSSPNAEERVITFTEAFTDSTPTAATGTGTANVKFVENGNTIAENLTSAHTTEANKHHPAEARAQRIEHRVIEHRFAGRPDGIDLLEPAVARAHARGEDEERG